MKRNIIIIIIGTFIIYIVAFFALYPRNGMIKNFYKLPNDSVDVLVLGSSNAYSNINPAIIYNETGLKSYLLCGSGQPLWNSYYYLQEAYKTQSPDVVVLEVFTAAAYDFGYVELSDVPADICSMKNSRNKIEMMKTAVPKTDLDEIILGLPIFHNRWTECFSSEIMPWQFDEKNGAMEKGFCPVYFFETKEEPIYNDTIKNEIPAKNKEYLIKIIELARQHNSQILFIKTPYVLSEYHDGIYNSVSDLANEYQVPFVNMKQIYKDFDFEYANDMADDVHLNNIGVIKVSKYLASVLKEYNYIEKKKSDNSWEEYAKHYDKTLFMCPEYQSEKLIFESNQIEMEQITNKLYMYHLKLPVNKNTYYKIEFEVDEPKFSLVADIVGPEYEKESLKRRIDYATDYTIIQTDENAPDECEFRIYGNTSHDISQVKIYEIIY